MDQRRTDGCVFSLGRPRNQTRTAGWRVVIFEAGGASNCLRDRRHDRAGGVLLDIQYDQPRRGWLGHSHGDRHRLRFGRPRFDCPARADWGQSISDRALAIVDDMGAVLVIALFYSSGIAWGALGGAAVMVLILVGFNAMGVRQVWPYLLGGLVLWYFVHESGI